MAKKESERTIKMKKEFMIYRNSGKTIKEIAKIFGVTNQCIYNHLQEIADENNVTREELLFLENRQHREENKSRREKESISIEELKKSFSDMIKNVEGIIFTIDNALKMEE